MFKIFNTAWITVTYDEKLKRIRIVKPQLLFHYPGEKFSDLAFLFRRGERTLSQAVYDTSKALFTVMKEKYLKVKHFHVWLGRTRIFG